MSPTLEIRRITVAVDASPASREAVKATAELASRLGAELIGVYVEDLDVLYASGLPFSAEVDLFSAVLRRVDRPGAERRLRGQAARARAHLEEAAARTQVPCSFQVLRGRVAAELRALATETDLVSLSRGRHRRRLGSTASELLALSGAGRFLLLPSTHNPGPLAVLYDGSPAAAHALSAAVQLSAGTDPTQELRVLLPTGDPESVESLRRDVTAALEPSGVASRFLTVESETGDRLAALDRALEPEPGGLLILPANHWLEREDLADFVGRLERAVLLVR